MAKHVKVAMAGNLAGAMRFDNAAIEKASDGSLTVQQDGEVAAYFPSGSWHHFTVEEAR